MNAGSKSPPDASDEICQLRELPSGSKLPTGGPKPGVHSLDLPIAPYMGMERPAMTRR